MPNKSCGNCAYRSGDTDIIYCQNKMHFGIAMKHDMVCDSWEPEKKKGLQPREKPIRGGAFSGDIHSPKKREKDDE